MTICLPEAPPAVHITCLTAAPAHGGIVQLPKKLKVCSHSSLEAFFHIISLWNHLPWLLFYPGTVACLNCPLELTFSVHMISEIPISSSKAWYRAGTSCSCLRTTNLCNHVVIFIAVPSWLTGNSLSQRIYHQLRWLPVIYFSEFEN